MDQKFQKRCSLTFLQRDELGLSSFLWAKKYFFVRTASKDRIFSLYLLEKVLFHSKYCGLMDLKFQKRCSLTFLQRDELGLSSFLGAKKYFFVRTASKDRACI